ncbi:MAG: 2TM domain-containing protein [Cyanobacteria bacterium J06623_5]
MPPRWPRKPDRANDPAYRKLEDRINFAVHVALFAAVNSGMWFFNTLNPGSLPLAKAISLVWVSGLVLHGLYIFAIADYSAKPASGSE